MPRKPKRGCRICGKNIGDRHGNAVLCGKKKCKRLYKNEYLRLYMAKRNLKKRWQSYEYRTETDKKVLNNQHMTGLGTFDLNGGPYEEIKREYELIQVLKKRAGLQ